MAEIKPPIVLNFTPPAGGGASRFGIEDNTGGEDRSFTLQNSYAFNLTSASEIELAAGDYENYSTPVSELNLVSSGLSLVYSDVTNPQRTITSIDFGSGTSGAVQINQENNGVSSSYLFPIVHAARFIPLSVNNTFAGPDGNITLEGGGGAAARFGIEDNLSDVDRSFDASHKGFEVYNASYTGITSQDDNGFAAFRTDLNAEPSNPVQAIIQTGGAADSSALVLTPTEIYVTTTRLNKNAHLALSVNNTFADAGGNITLSKGEFADNAAALAGGLTTGDVYHTGGVLKIVI